MTTYLEAWAALPLSKITKDMIEQRHAEIGRTSPARANYTMRFLRALFNFAQERYEVNGEPLVPVNPVTRLSRARAWYPERRRSSYIKPHELAAWFAGVEAVQSEAGRAYLKLVLLTGLRKNEALKLAWRDVDLEGRTLRVPRTKNGRPHELPLSDYLFELLDGRREIAKASPWVFPGLDLKCAMVEPKRSIEQAIARGAPAFTSHDLRRTFATIVSGYLERSLSVYEIKRLLNHATQDVTAGYVQHDLEHLRPAMQAVTDFVLRAAAVRPSAEVVALEARRPLIDPRGTVNAA
jgi:integrase